MISKLISFGLILSIVYVLGVFFIPEVLDTYGNKEINAKIREYKKMSLEFASGGENPTSIIDQITGTSQGYIDDTKKTYEILQNTLSGKIEDVETATDSMVKAMQAVNAAKADIEKAVNLSLSTGASR